MKQLLSISVTTKEWTEGNHAWFDAKIKPGAVVEVHWGDGRHSTFPHYRENWSRVEHYYGCEGTAESFEIEFLSDDEESLITLIDGTWEMTAHSVRLKNCPSLKAMQYCQAYKFDFSGASQLELLDCHEYYGESIDVSTLPCLRQLSVRLSPYLQSLSLNKNHLLEVLNIGYCHKLTKVAVSNNSNLKLLSYDFTRLGKHSLQWLEKIIKRNGGEIVDWIDVAFSSVGIMRNN